MPQNPRKPIASRLKFVGTPDHYVTGIAQSELAIVPDDAPQDETHVSRARAAELVATRMYAPVDGDVSPAEKNDEAASAAEEVA